MAQEEAGRKFSRLVHPLSTSGTFHRDARAAFWQVARPCGNPGGGLRMNFAQMQRGGQRHPVGLMVVVGAHVLLAALLLSAKIAHNPPVVEPVANLLPDPPKPPPKPVDEPQVRQAQMPNRLVIVVPK